MRKLQIKVSELPFLFAEQYIVVYWYRNQHGFYTKTQQDFYAEGKNSHHAVEQYARAFLMQYLRDVNIVSVVYG